METKGLAKIEIKAGSCVWWKRDTGERCDPGVSGSPSRRTVWQTASSTSAQGMAGTLSCPWCCHRNGWHLRSHAHKLLVNQRKQLFYFYREQYETHGAPDWIYLKMMTPWLCKINIVSCWQIISNYKRIPNPNRRQSSCCKALFLNWSVTMFVCPSESRL